ncbi:hypothetical protein G5I_04752 [Acromyrmex echinatior]|uniref:Uncharacterized protein n=1 Tax=Acromyrmex echinatior TaxID=103372 RepID=F4WGH4_ACREC|nr:hypothetical protein G5I_04752 [Acromyrmex echinatior]
MYFALCHPSNIRDLTAEQLKYIPKVVLLRVYGEYIEHIWDKLSEIEEKQKRIETPIVIGESPCGHAELGPLAKQ